MTKLRYEHESESGQAIVEYALILAFVASVSVAMLTLVGTNVGALLDKLRVMLDAIVAGL
ncbi:MAG TPA: Flp family type IVb pilin [Gaiellaceae bacterium]|nr:Flp family type IVb pilin [Gaiellaceae bacterium]